MSSGSGEIRQRDIYISALFASGGIRQRDTYPPLYVIYLFG